MAQRTAAARALCLCGRPHTCGTGEPRTHTPTVTGTGPRGPLQRLYHRTDALRPPPRDPRRSQGLPVPLATPRKAPRACLSGARSLLLGQGSPRQSLALPGPISAENRHACSGQTCLLPPPPTRHGHPRTRALAQFCSQPGPLRLQAGARAGGSRGRHVEPRPRTPWAGPWSRGRAPAPPWHGSVLSDHTPSPSSTHTRAHAPQERDRLTFQTCFATHT